ncbi:MAG: glycerol-3-phosphate acyltransferase [Chloroflexota bacterium]
MLIAWLIAAYLCGALPWSVWLGRLFFRADPRQQSDGNPGAANAFRAAGWRLGIAVLLLDFLKALLPVLVAYRGIGFQDAEMLLIALMPTLGHAFSVFLGLRGGRAIVVMFGVWTALTLYSVPLVMGITAIAATLLTRKDTVRTLAIPVVLLLYLMVQSAPGWMLALAVGQMLVMVIKISAARWLPKSGKSAT